MDAKIHFEKVKEFDREIKEAKNAACYALTLDEKLNEIKRVKTLESQRLEFRKKWIISEFEKEKSVDN